MFACTPNVTRGAKLTSQEGTPSSSAGADEDHTSGCNRWRPRLTPPCPERPEHAGRRSRETNHRGREASGAGSRADGLLQSGASGATLLAGSSGRASQSETTGSTKPGGTGGLRSSGADKVGGGGGQR